MEFDSPGLKPSSYLGFQLLVLALMTWVTGQRFLLPSIGPTVFALATRADEEVNFPYRVVVGHSLGAGAAFLAVQLFLGGIEPTSHFRPLSVAGLRQAAAMFVAVVLATGGMYAFDAQHPPVYATTLIISLGFLRTPAGLLVFLLSVLAVVGIHELVGKRLDVWNLPYEYEETE
jgi:hypothetical protein